MRRAPEARWVCLWSLSSNDRISGKTGEAWQLCLYTQPGQAARWRGSRWPSEFRGEIGNPHGYQVEIGDHGSSGSWKRACGEEGKNKVREGIKAVLIPVGVVENAEALGVLLNLVPLSIP